MLYLSLVLSVLLLALANATAWRPKRCPMWVFFVCGFAFTLCPAVVMILAPVGLAFFLLGGALILCAACHWGPRVFLPLSGLVALVVFGWTGWLAWQAQERYDALRARYPFQSMEARVPAPRAISRGTPLAEPSERRLSLLEEELDRYRVKYRTWRLRQLHESTTASFVNSPGFGVGRMQMAVPTEQNLSLPQDPPVPQPGDPVPVTDSPGDLEQSRQVRNDDALSDLHLDNVRDFVYPEGLGFVKDRAHVAGFEPHRFRSTPTLPASWRLQAVELVGLLVHDEPVVYVSRHLPRMDEVRDGPTRSLDTFESVGLAALRRGDDLFVRDAAGGVRMLGAIRAAKQCTTCHGCERGDLLGAFSYTLRGGGR
jgi:hypothetical protein